LDAPHGDCIRANRLNRENCQHHVRLASAVAVIRWGSNASSDKLRQSARRTVCGTDVGFLPFPTDKLSHV
jgi:hypothetical protein